MVTDSLGRLVMVGDNAHNNVLIYDKSGKLRTMLQKEPVFKRCHDVCIDDDTNIYGHEKISNIDSH
jgi:hypothetical protein